MRSDSRSVARSVCLYRMSEPLPRGEGIYLGKTMIYNLPFYLDRSAQINPHMAIIGMSGSGKSYLLKSFVARSVLYEKASMLAIDWNDEYCDLVGFLSGTVLNFGKDFKINIMDTYSASPGGAANVVSLIDSILGLDKSQKSTLNMLLSALFAETGPKTLKNLLAKLKAADPNLASKVSHLNGNPFFSDTTEFDINRMLDGVCSINLSTLRDNSQRAELVRFILRLVIDCMHRSRIGGTSQRILVLDESWRLLKNSDEVGTLYREGRKYGISVISATQMAADINNEVVANAGCIAIFRLQSEQDYKILENTGLIDGVASETIGSLDVGSCMLCLAQKSGASAQSKFYIRKVSGIEFGRILLYGDKMKHEMSYSKFLEVTGRMERPLQDKISSFVLQNHKSLELASFVRHLTEIGIERTSAVSYLRELGIDDLAIVNAYENS